MTNVIDNTLPAEYFTIPNTANTTVVSQEIIFIHGIHKQK